MPISRKAASPSQQGLLANRERILEQLMNTFDNALQDEFFEVKKEMTAFGALLQQPKVK